MAKKKAADRPGATCFWCFGKGHRDYPIVGRVACRKCQGTGRITDKEELLRTSKLLKDAIRKEGRRAGMEAEVARGRAFLAEAKSWLAQEV